MRLVVKIASAIVVIVGLVGYANVVNGCTCAPAPLSGHYEKATLVFAGYPTVIRLRESSWQNRPLQLLVVEFRVEKWWKGGRGKKVIVETGMGGGDCGSDFRVGRRYVIFAHKTRDGWLSTNICSGNMVYGLLDRETAELDQLANPQSPSK